MKALVLIFGVWVLCFYVLVCGYLPFDGNSYLELFTKILTCNYTMPDDLSSECKDLISKMLVVDPMERIKIDDIRTHAWILLDNSDPVPKEITPVNFEETPRRIDNSIIETLKEMGYDPEQATKEVLANSYTDVTSTYNLLLSKKERNQSSPETLEEIYELLSSKSIHTSSIKISNNSKSSRDKNKNKGHRRRKTVGDPNEIKKQPTETTHPHKVKIREPPKTEEEPQENQRQQNPSKGWKKNRMISGGKKKKVSKGEHRRHKSLGGEEEKKIVKKDRNMNEQETNFVDNTDNSSDDIYEGNLGRD